MIYDEHHLHMAPDYAAQLIQNNLTDYQGKKYSLDEILDSVWHAGFSEGWDSATFEYHHKSQSQDDEN